MAMNPLELMKLAERYQIFMSQHPKMGAFYRDVITQAIREGSILDIKVTDPDGKEYFTNMRLTKEDMETIEILKNLKG